MIKIVPFVHFEITQTFEHVYRSGLCYSFVYIHRYYLSIRIIARSDNFTVYGVQEIHLFDLRDTSIRIRSNVLISNVFTNKVDDGLIRFSVPKWLWILPTSWYYVYTMVT